jgi:hypothetical protein
MATKRRDECIACTSRSCYERVWTDDGSYDEVSCRRHINDLFRHSDRTIPGVMRHFATSTAKQRRIHPPRRPA